MERVYSAVFGEDAQKPGKRLEDDVMYEEYIRPLTPELLEQHNLHISQYGDLPRIHMEEKMDRKKKSLNENRSELSELGNALKSGIRAFFIAYGAKAFTALLMASRKWEMDTHTYADAIRLLSQGDTVRFGGFVGILVSSFHTSEILLNYIRGKNSNDSLNKLIAGGLSGLALFVDTPSRRPIISLYIFIRMLDVYLRHASERYIFLREIEKNLPLEYATEILFALSNGPIIYATAYEPRLLSKSYYNFILNMGNMTHHGVEYALRRRYRGDIDPHTKEIVEFTRCQPHFHRESCLAHSTKDWVSDGMIRAGKLYIPVHFMPLFLFKYKKLLAAPVSSIAYTIFATARSSAFISTYQTIVKLFICSSRNICSDDYGASAVVAGFLTGFSLFFEDPKRRNELMLYTSVRGLEVLWLILKKKGIASYIRMKHGDVFFFSLSMACIMSTPPKHYKPSYISLLRFLFGSNAI